jgi:ADP-heptose:LPS heptosyltransferase
VWLKDAPPIDRQIPIGGLPRLLRAGLTAFPRHHGYLVPDPGFQDIWRDRYAKLGEGLKIGISWRGGGLPAVKMRRSTTLDQWRDILKLPDAHFINLQYGDTTADRERARQQMGAVIHDWEDSDPLKDMDYFAAKVAMLDLVISVDNSTVHMAGALGVTAWVLQPFAPDWRWLREREDSPWYPSVRLFRADRPGAWEGVLSRIVQSLSHDGSRDASSRRRR